MRVERGGAEAHERPAGVRGQQAGRAGRVQHARQVLCRGRLPDQRLVWNWEIEGVNYEGLVSDV